MALPCPAFADAFTAVTADVATAGVLPVENSLAGSILETYDLLLAHELAIVGEVLLPVRHCLMARPGTALADVRLAYSHPQALAQSQDYLAAHGIEPRAAFDTAGAARALSEREEPGAAAIASARAAAIYGLAIIAEGIQTRPDNTTRFFVIAKEPRSGPTPTKASVVFATLNRPGALHACLAVLVAHGLNLTKLESRPTRNALWEYHFYMDIEAPAGDLAARLAAAVTDLTPETTFLRVLGAYRASRAPITSSRGG